MANLTFSSASLSENPMISTSSSSGAAVDDSFEDACSICLEPFTAQDPPTVTSCKHEYHLQCILDWSQRSKECPICWQLLILKDPASQELLVAVEIERHLRSRNLSSGGSTNLPHLHEDFDIEQDSYSDDSDFDEHIMQHIAATAGRAHYVQGRARAPGLTSSQVLVFTSPANVPGAQHTNISPDEPQNLSYGSVSSPTPGTPSVANAHLSPTVPSAVNELSSTAVNTDGPLKARIFLRQPPTDTSQGPGSSEMSFFSDSIKTKWFAASARYKESISKSTRGIKEKLLARNNSVKELTKGVQREMSAGIAGVARMIERLDLTSKRTGASFPSSGFSGGTSNFSLKGKGVQENIIAQTLDKKSEETVCDVSGTSPGQLEIPNVQRDR